ncbi:MAG: PqqD family protein [Ruminococcus sp.]|nr:PqqD family protein [Ruminococcus sp.]MBQ2470327.1 PqqD family protein [Ruminococcus sp.]MBQ4171075.1 PqqD family protein [Ruminococcus sp.]MBQ4261211.1 PqqD family protein [Ruminococcus sp.]SCX24723.1 Coenzyme PQQ synthesis protein D (PqqD) [Ruminococcaceae bacterium P7]
MKIKDNFLLRKVADSYVVVPVGKLTLDFNGIITLNETGAFLFEQLQKGAEREDLIENLLKEYDVDPEKAAADIDVFLEKVKDADVLE